jgi:hypothetical protein
MCGDWQSPRWLADIFGARAAVHLGKRGETRALVTLLDGCHRALWALEDQARSRLADDQEIAETKRRIDRQNGERHHLIDRIDREFIPPGPPRTGGLRAYSETIGELCDRLLIVNLKMQNLDRLRGDMQLALADRESCADQLERFRGWQAHLQMCLAATLSDLRDGTAWLPPRAERKLYNEARLNPVTRAEGRRSSG